jgi:hypothetical protein
MNFLLAIILVFYAVLAAPIPGLNLNLVRTNAQKIAHYDKLVAQLQERFGTGTYAELNNIARSIVRKRAKIKQLRLTNLVTETEYESILKEAIELATVLPVRHPDQIHVLEKVRRIFSIDRNDLELARRHMHDLREYLAQISANSQQANHLRASNQPTRNIKTNLLPVVHEPVDITRALESLSGASPGHALPVRIKPEILDYSEILKLATEIVTAVPQSSEYSEYLKKMLGKLRAINSSDLKEARSQLDMIWYMVRTLVLEEN